MLSSRSFRSLAATGVALLAASGVRAQAPAAGPMRGPSVEGISEYRLPNGLRVLLYPDKSKPQVTVNVTYLVGSRHEGYGETGMAHLLEHMLYKGTPKHRSPSQEISAHGAQFNASTSFDRTNYFATFAAADSNLAWAIDLEADRMVNSFIAKEDLDKEFTVVRSEFERDENDPFLVTLKRVLGSAYLFHAYDHLPIGARSDIENVPIERLQAFYHKYYQPDNAIVMVAGNFDEARVLAMVQEKFGALPRPVRALQATYTVEPTQDGERVAAVRRSGDAQLLLSYYHVPAGTHPDFPAIDVLTRVLGDQAAGRLHKALVATKLAGAVQAENLQQHDPGGIFLAARLRREQSLDSAQAALFTVADEIATTKPPTDEEVARAKATVLNSFETAPKNTSTFGLQLSEWMAMGDWRLFFYHRDRVKAVTTQDVQRVASQYLKPSNRTLGMFIPTDKADRVEIAAAPNVDSLLKNFKSEGVVAAGEAFDPTVANIESRVKRSTLPSGLGVVLLPKKNRGETVTAFLSLRFGTEQSLANRGAAATLASQMLMRGTKSLTRQQLRDSLDRLKARLQTSTPGAGVVRVVVETTRPNLPAALRLVGEMVRQPAFDAKDLDELQRETISAIEAQRSEPTVMGQTLFAKQVLKYPKGHPRYVASADEQVEALKATTLADVKKFHADFYGASHGELVIIGDFDDAAVMKAASEQFGTWKSAKPFKPVPTVLAAATPGRQQVEAPDKPNAFFLAGQTFPMKDTDPDYPAMLLANAILGESALDSRLPARIRVKEGLSYIVQSVISANSIDRAAQWMALAVYAPQNADKVTAAFTDEMNTILQNGFSAEEVDKAKGAYLQRRKLARGNDTQLSQQLSTALYLGRTMSFDEALEAKIAALTPDQVNAAVRRVLDPSKMAIVLVGDFAKAKLAATPK